MATDKPRLSISMDEETFEKVLAFKEERGIATQSKAIIRIMEMGLEDLEKTVKNKKAPLYSSEAMQLAQDYDEKLDTWGQKQVRDVADNEILRCKAETQKKQEAERQARAVLQEQKNQMETAEEIAPSIVLDRPYAQVAAAEGSGAFLMDEGCDKVSVEINESTKKADVILKVVGRSMEPLISDGDCVLVRIQPSVNIGEIGVFIMDGQGYLKERGADRLISLNHDIDDVFIGDFQQVECYGKFISVLDPDWILKK